MSTPNWSRRRLLRTAALGAGGLGAAALAGCGLAEEGHKAGPTPSASASTAPVGTFLLGLNVSGMEDPYPEGPTDAMLDAYAGHGIRHLRLPGSWKRLQPELRGPLEQGYLTEYRRIIRAAGDRGMRISLDACHNDFTGRDLVGPDRVDGAPEVFADFWKRMVDALGDESAIEAWDLMNEPDQVDPQGIDKATRASNWQSVAQAAITAIRGTGDTRTIKVEGCGFSSAASFRTNNPTLHELEDPRDGLVYSAHCYLDRHNSGQHYYWDEEVRAGDGVTGGAMTKDVGVKRIQLFVDWLRQYGKRGEIGECGAGRQDSPDSRDDTGWLTALDTTLAYCRDNGVGLYFWGTGVHLNKDYGYSVEPFADGTPAPQWKVLEKYA